MPELDPLVTKAKEYQAHSGMTDERFAREVLRITPGYWSKLRRGIAAGSGGKFVRAMLTRFPELAFSSASGLPVVIDKPAKRAAQPA